LRVAESGSGVLPDALGNTVAYCAMVGIAGTGLGIALLPGMLDHLGPGASATTELAVVSIPISMLGAVLGGICLGLGDVARYNVSRITGGVTVLCASLGLVATGTATPATVVGATMAGGIVGVGIAGAGLPWRRMTLGLVALRRDLAYGLRVFLTSLLSLINARLDIVLMTAFVSASEIGWYTVACNAMLPITIITTTLASLIMPAIGGARGARQDESDDDHMLIRSTAARYGLLMLAVAAALAIAAPFAVPLVFGQAFDPAVALIWILVPGFVLQGYAYIVDSGMVGLRKPWVGNAAQGAGVVITAALLPFLLPRYGATGAAITSTCAYSTSALISVWALGRVRARSAAGGAHPTASTTVSPDLAEDVLLDDTTQRHRVRPN
jgi:O-antigen/teichoic acid export membrane protein